MTEETLDISLYKLLKLTHDIDENRVEHLYRNLAIQTRFTSDCMIVGVGKKFVRVVIEE